jgi:DNA invertase Pin-like site-specific DNA recombinase
MSSGTAIMSTTNEQYDFSKRIRPKEEQPTMLQLVELLHRRMTFVYKRLSTHEQIKKSIFSIAMQDALEEMAISDGYLPEFGKEQVQAVKDAADYPGFYINGQIIVEERDLGISGTLGSDERPGLAHLIEKIEKDIIESLYVVHISRLFRDQTLINGLTFGELCKKHNVLLIMPNMRLNLRDRMHERIYRMELDRAAEELEIMKMRLGGAKELKAKQGFYASGLVAVGYRLDREKDSKTYDKYMRYEPHARIIRKIFDSLLECNLSTFMVARRLQDEGIFVPRWPLELQYMENRSATKKMTPTQDGKGYLITPRFVERVITNPAYIGWWIWGGSVIGKENHQPIIDEETFWFVQQRLHEKGNPKGRAVYSEPMMLHKLLICAHSERHLFNKMNPMLQDRVNRRYYCNGGYDPSRGVCKYCFSLADYVLEKPISEYVVYRCSFPDYAEKVVQVLRTGYDEAKDKAANNRREFARLQREIEKLKENLAYTKTQQQAEMILGLIDERKRNLEQSAKAGVKAYPAGRVGKEMNIDRVTNLLESIGKIWNDGGKKKSDRFKNELLRILLNRIVIKEKEAERGGNIIAKIVWVTGTEEELEITRPRIYNRRDDKWTEEEESILRKYYGKVNWMKLCEALPGRTYGAILMKANVLKLRGKSSRKGLPLKRWSEEDDEFLKKAVTKEEVTLEQIGEQLMRNPDSVRQRLKILGLPSVRKFAETEDRKRIPIGLLDASHSGIRVEWKIIQSRDRLTKANGGGLTMSTYETNEGPNLAGS